ncbi:hypothetical protein ABPG74_002872 [Tetrahymena malaccensis]
MNFNIQQYKQQCLEHCNLLLSMICDNGHWNKFEDIEVIDQSYYDIYNQEAWDIFIFQNCGLSEQQSKFRRCKLGHEGINDSPSNFASVNELFHYIIDMKRNIENMQHQNECYSEGSSDHIF